MKPNEIPQPKIQVSPLFQIKTEKGKKTAVLSVQLAPVNRDGFANTQFDSKVIPLYSKVIKATANIEEMTSALEALRKEYKRPKYKKLIEAEKAIIERKGFPPKQKSKSKKHLPQKAKVSKKKVASKKSPKKTKKKGKK